MNRMVFTTDIKKNGNDFDNTYFGSLDVEKPTLVQPAPLSSTSTPIIKLLLLCLADAFVYHRIPFVILLADNFKPKSDGINRRHRMEVGNQKPLLLGTR